ncbi:MAG: 1-phosphofructokinase family hexose kinase [Pontiellaceae bacterium]
MASPTKSICFGFAPALQKISRYADMKLGEVNRAWESRWGLGGKGTNTARMIRQLGGNSFLVGFCGGANGSRYLHLLDKEGIDHDHVTVEGEMRICHTLIEEQAVTELIEEMPAILPKELAKMEQLIKSLDLSGMVALSGKVPAGIPDDFYEQIAAVVRRQGGRVILDTQGEPLLRALDQRPFVKINREELCRTMQASTLLGAAESLLMKGASGLLVTDGAQPAQLFNDGKHWQVQPPQLDAINPVGSGDAVTAGMMVALDQGASVREAVRLGMACGAANALQLMCGILDIVDVNRLKEDVLIERV